MAAIHEAIMPWHEGEMIMHDLLKIPNFTNPTSLSLFPSAKYLLQYAPLLALGILDDEGRPWTTIWGGREGFTKPLGSSKVGIKAVVDQKYDPLPAILFQESNNKVGEDQLRGRMISGLALDLDSRQRIKLYGRMVAGTLGSMKDQENVCAIQLLVKIEQSLGNCPKYMNCKHIRPSIPTPKLISDSPHLPEAALALIAKADLFFLSSSNHESDMDTNIRGGPPGFVRVLSNSTDGAVLVWPEYSGNRLYQSLGNLQTTPLAGLVFPDFDSGNVLYVTGKTEILANKQAGTLLPGSNLAVVITLSAARFVENGLAFRGDLGERSPYNPKVRYLSTEKGLNVPQVPDQTGVMAKLINKEIITPTTARFRFGISDLAAAGKWKPGQYVTLSLEQQLSQGYSHMRDDDPTSLNDSYMRTFTVSSFPHIDTSNEEFEITIRNVGKVTNYLFRANDRSGLEISLPGFGGDFRFRDEDVQGGVMPFIASGIGITPLLGQLPGVDVSRVHLFWTLNMKDIALVTDTFSRFPELPKTSAIFLTGTSGKISVAQQRSMEKFSELGARVEGRRLQSSDLQVPGGAERWYLCTGTELRMMVLKWLAGKTVIYENFDY